MLDLPDVILNHAIHRHPLQVSHWSSPHWRFALPRCVSFHLACFIECFLPWRFVDGLLFCTPHVHIRCIELFGNPSSYAIATVAPWLWWLQCTQWCNVTILSPLNGRGSSRVQIPSHFVAITSPGSKFELTGHFSIMPPWSSALLTSAGLFSRASKMQGCLKVNSGQNSAASCQNEHYLKVARLPAWE